MVSQVQLQMSYCQVIHNIYLEVFERKVKTYQTKQTFMKRDDTLVVLVPYPLIPFKGNPQSKERLTSVKVRSRPYR